MADKQLTESAWKAFAKGKPAYKQDALLKALDALDKAERTGPADWLEALDEVDKQADVLRKTNKADKDLGSYLDGVGKAVAKDRKTAEAARDKATADADDEESPALLTTTMVPLLRDVRKPDVVMQVLIATTGKEMAVLMSRKSIPPARGKLLKEYLGVTSGVRLIQGHCLFEEKAHTFVVTTQAAGLAKKLKAALLAQTEARYKVRVRGEDGEVDDDGEPAEGNADGAPAAAGGAASTAEAAAAATAATATPAQPAAATPAEADDGTARFMARLKLLKPAMDAGLAGEPGLAKEVKLAASEMSVFVRKREFDAAHGQLDRIESLLGISAPPPAPPEPPPMPAAQTAGEQAAERAEWEQRLGVLGPELRRMRQDGGLSPEITAALAEARRLSDAGDLAQALDLMDEVELELIGSLPPSNVSFQRMRLRWVDGKQRVAQEIAALKAASLTDFDDAETRANVQRLDEVLGAFDEGLADTLDDFVNAEPGAKRDDLKARAAAIVTRYLDFIDSSPLVDHIEDNPFVQVSVRLPLMQPLQLLDVELQKGGA